MIIHIKEYPSAGTGRQGELKLRWFIFVNVQVVSRIVLIIIFNLTQDPLVKRLRHNVFTVTSWVQPPGGLYWNDAHNDIYFIEVTPEKTQSTTVTCVALQQH